jgi:hypothetical protein
MEQIWPKVNLQGEKKKIWAVGQGYPITFQLQDTVKMIFHKTNLPVSKSSHDLSILKNM